MLKTLILIKQLLIGIVLFILFFFTQNVIVSSDIVSSKITFSLIFVLITLSILILLKNKYTSKLLSFTQILNSFFNSLKYFLAFYFIYILITYAYYLISPSESSTISGMSFSSLFIGAFTFCSIPIVLSSALEEMLFRYYIFSLLIYHKTNLYLSILINSLIFALFHVFTYDLYLLVYITIIGIGFSMLYILVGRIGAPIGIHFANNYLVDIDSNNENSNVVYTNFYEVLKDNNSMNVILILILILWIYQKIIHEPKMT